MATRANRRTWRGWGVYLVVNASVLIATARDSFGQRPAPAIGGTPVFTSTDVLSGTALEMTVYSYVYRGVGSAVPAGFAAVAAHETLFIYYCINSGSTDIQAFAINNPNGLPVHSSGIGGVTPSGADAADRNDPDALSAGPVQIQYEWSDDPGVGLERLHPGQWSVVFYRVFGSFAEVDAAAYHIGLAEFGYGLLAGPVSPPPPVIGDLNCDQVVNTADVSAFILAICDPPAYYAAYPGCDGERADVNGDNAMNGRDIQAFVELLLGGP